MGGSKGRMSSAKWDIAVAQLGGLLASWQSNSIRHISITHHKAPSFCPDFWHEHTMLPLGYGVLWQESLCVQELLPTCKTTVEKLGCYWEDDLMMQCNSLTSLTGKATSTTADNIAT